MTDGGVSGRLYIAKFRSEHYPFGIFLREKSGKIGMILTYDDVERFSRTYGVDGKKVSRIVKPEKTLSVVRKVAGEKPKPRTIVTPPLYRILHEDFPPLMPMISNFPGITSTTGSSSFQNLSEDCRYSQLVSAVLEMRQAAEAEGVNVVLPHMEGTLLEHYLAQLENLGVSLAV